MSTGAGFPDRTEVPSVVVGPENAVAKALLVDDRKDSPPPTATPSWRCAGTRSGRWTT